MLFGNVRTSEALPFQKSTVTLIVLVQILLELSSIEQSTVSDSACILLLIDFLKMTLKIEVPVKAR